MKLTIFKVQKTLTNARQVCQEVYKQEDSDFRKRVKETLQCPDCGSTEFNLYPDEFVAVKEGGKPYIECAKCGYTTHL